MSYHFTVLFSIKNAVNSQDNKTLINVRYQKGIAGFGMEATATRGNGVASSLIPGMYQAVMKSVMSYRIDTWSDSDEGKTLPIGRGQSR
jgi:hypothetical protein